MHGILFRLIPSQLLSIMMVFIAIHAESASQDRSLSVIHGAVCDSLSGDPLENAIVYFENSPIGTSTGPDGTFSLVDIPVGTFTLIISRVDYQHRTISLTVANREIKTLLVKLLPTPIPTSGMDIVSDPPEVSDRDRGTTPGYFPVRSPGVLGIYGLLSTTPLALINTDSALFLASVDTAFVNEEKYVRLWIMYLNLSKTPQEYSPHLDVRLSVISREHTYSNIEPEPNDWLWTMLDSQSVFRAMSASIQTSLESMSRLRTEYLYQDGVFLKLLALDGLLRANLTRTRDMPRTFTPARDGSLSGRLYNAYMGGVNVGLLSRYRVFPENSVHGYLYFPHPGLRWNKQQEAIQASDLSRYEITIKTPNGMFSILFVPN